MLVSITFSSPVYSQTKEEIDAAVNQAYSFLNQFNDSLSSSLRHQDYEEAIEMCHAIDSVFKAEKLNETFFYSYVLQNMTIVYECISDSINVYTYGKKALEAWEKYKLYESDNGLESYLGLLGSVAQSCMKQCKYEEAVEYFGKRIANTDINMRNSEDYAYSLYCLGVAYHYLLKVKESDSFLQKAKGIFVNTGKTYLLDSIDEFISKNSLNGSFLINERKNLLSELDELERACGVQDTVYLNKIIEAGILYQDTIYHRFWPSLAEKMLKVQTIIPNVYGIDSEKYRLYMVGLNGLSLGRYIEKGNYINDIWDVIHSLEKIYSKVNNNRIEFATLIASYYEYKMDDGDRAIYWLKEKYKLAKKNKDVDPRGYQYAMMFLVQSYCKFNKDKKIKSLIDDLDVSDLTLTEQKNCWSGVLTSLNSNTSDEIILVLIEKYKKSLGQLNEIQYLIQKLCVSGRNALVERIEDVLELKKYPLVSQYEYYKSKALMLGLGEHHSLAIPCWEKCVELAYSIGDRSLLYSTDHQHYYLSLAFHYFSLNDWDNHLRYYIKALDDIEIDFGKESMEYLDACIQISIGYSNTYSDSQKALVYAEMAMPAIEKNYGKDSDYCGRVIQNIINLNRNLGRVEEAIRIGLERLGNDNNRDSLSTKGMIYNQLAMCFSDIHDYANAELYYQNALKCEEKAAYFGNLASLYRDVKRYDDALNVLKKEENFLIKTKCDNERVLFSYNYGMARYYDAVSPDNAIPYYKKAESYIDKRVGLIHQVAFYQTWAHCYMKINNKYKQRECLDKCLTLYNDENCNDSILYGVILHDYAAYYEDIADYSKAEELYNKAIGIFQRIGVNVDDDRYTTLLNNYAVFCDFNGNKETAIKIEKTLCNIRKMSLGEHHDDYILTLRNLLSSEIKLKDIAAVDSVYKEYLIATDGIDKYDKDKVYIKAIVAKAKGDLVGSEKLFQSVLGWSKDDDIKGNVLGELCDIYMQLRSPKVYDVLSQYVDLHKKRLIDKLLYMSTEERKNLQSYYFRNLLIENIGIDNRVVDLASNYCLFHKSISLQTHKAIERRLARNKNANPSYTLLKEKRSDLARAISVGNQSLAEKCQEEIGRLERKLTFLFTSSNKIYGDLNIGTSDVLSKIGNDLGLNFVRYGADVGALRYGVFLISQRIKKPLFVDLCSEKELVNASDMEVKSNAENLYSLIWQPLEQYMKEYSKVYFSPDGLLNKIAIETITGSGPCSSIDYYRVFSLVDVAKKNKPVLKHVLAMGDIDYDDMDAYISESSRGSRGKLKKWNSLKGTALELASLSEALSTLKDIKIDLFVQDKASEGQFKSYDNSSVNCIHLATHGFFYDNLMQNESAFNHRLFSCNMFTSAGLLLSGANKAWTSQILLDDNSEDGILTPDEVETLSFPNLNLVILSACETGLGNIDVDGVWGMQRSFRIAGAENLIVSLSKINDAITANFMADFYSNIACQRSIHDSFYLAQKKMAQKYSDDADIYSAFILVE